MMDEYRDTMFSATLIEKPFVKEIQVVKTKYIDKSLDEIIDLFVKYSPTCLYVTPYSQTTPCIYITKQIFPSHDGVWLYFDSWAEKKPIFYSWAKLYTMLSGIGFEFINFYK